MKVENVLTYRPTASKQTYSNISPGLTSPSCTQTKSLSPFGTLVFKARNKAFSAPKICTVLAGYLAKFVKLPGIRSSRLRIREFRCSDPETKGFEQLEWQNLQKGSPPAWEIKRAPIISPIRAAKFGATKSILASWRQDAYSGPAGHWHWCSLCCCFNFETLTAEWLGLGNLSSGGTDHRHIQNSCGPLHCP